MNSCNMNPNKSENCDHEELNSNDETIKSNCTEEKSGEVIPGFKSVDDFIKASFGTIQNGIKSSNSLPNGENFKYYSCFPTFNEVRNDGIKKIEELMERIVKFTGVAGSMRNHDTEEKFKLLIDANDVLLDRTSVILDEESGIQQKPGVELIVSQTQKGNYGSWNTSTTVQVVKSSPVSNSAQAIRLLAAKNVQRPQLSFKDKIDNSTKPWMPRIKDKPNAIKPLGIYLIDGENGQVFCHPYEFELDRFTPPDKQLRKNNPQLYKPVDKTPLVMVEKLEELHKMMEDIETHSEIAIDLEHHSYRTFQGITCLMQISTRDTDYLVDTLTLRSELHILNELFTNPSVLKVFHGADLDIQWLQRDLSLYIVNMFDTHQAAKQLNLPYLSLSYLLKTHCKVDPNKHFQLADWRIRPLPNELVRYAREDTHYLLYIKDILRNALIDAANGQSNILKAVYDRSTIICKRIYEKPTCDENSCMSMYRKSQKMFNNRQLYALKALYMWRDETARVEDDSTGYVLPNHMLLNIVETLPREMQGILACCNPIPPLVRQNLLKLHKLILKAREQPLIKPILETEVRQRVTQSNRIEASPWIWSPHDLPHGIDVQANLPCLLDEDMLNNTQNSQNELDNATNIAVEHSITVFDSPENSDDESCAAKQRLRKARKLFVSPYERYKLVIPMVAAEEAERERKKQAEEEKLNLAVKQEAEDTVKHIERVHQHFLQIVKKESNDVVIDDAESHKPDVSIGSLDGAKKRKRDYSFPRDAADNDDNCNDEENDQALKKAKSTTKGRGNFVKRLDAYGGSVLKKKEQRKMNRQELREKGMLPQANFNYKDVDFSSFQGGSESNTAKIAPFNQEKRKNKMKGKGGKRKKERLGI